MRQEFIENQKCMTRKSDVYFRNDGFYFHTREGANYGPYTSEEQARLARSLFVYCLEGDETAPLPVTDAQFKIFIELKEKNTHHFNDNLKTVNGDLKR
jgi:hypothetical protein